MVRQCAPTLAGIKTGSLFTCPYENRETMLAEVRDLNRRLTAKGLWLLPLRCSPKRVLLYLYRPTLLRRDLADSRAAGLLRQAGYPEGGCGRYLGTLVRRIRENEEFPHEIGLFLSYPPEDVQGFIDHHATDQKFTGTWKVYGDEKLARARFAAFARCTDLYCERWRAGFSLEQLAVTV